MASSYGLGRYGYGLFLPDIRREFGLSVGTLGTIASVGYVGQLLALSTVGIAAGRVGSRLFIATGGVSTCAAMVLIGVAPTPIVLALGAVLAGMSPGWIWASYSDVVAETVERPSQPRVLSMISAGTSVGVVAAGGAALALSGPLWRAAWLAFAVVTAWVVAWNVCLIPARGRRQSHRELRREFRDSQRVHRESLIRGIVSLLRRPSVVPLCSVAFSTGVVGATYWTFAVTAVSHGATSRQPLGALLWMLVGAAGVTAVFTGDAVQRYGLRTVFLVAQVALTVAVGAVGLAPGQWFASVLSGVLYGASYLAISALLSLWSAHLSPDQATRGLSLTIICLTLGAIVGPAVFGAIADRYSLRAVFLLASGIALLTAQVNPVRHRGPHRPPVLK